MYISVLSDDAGALIDAWLGMPSDQEFAKHPTPLPPIGVVTLSDNVKCVVWSSRQTGDLPRFAMRLSDALDFIFLAFADGWCAFARHHERTDGPIDSLKLSQQFLREWRAAGKPQDKFTGCMLEPGMTNGLKSVAFSGTPDGQVKIPGYGKVVLFNHPNIQSITLESFKTGWKAHHAKIVAAG